MHLSLIITPLLLQLVPMLLRQCMAMMTISLYNSGQALKTRAVINKMSAKSVQNCDYFETWIEQVRKKQGKIKPMRWNESSSFISSQHLPEPQNVRHKRYVVNNFSENVQAWIEAASDQKRSLGRTFSNIEYQVEEKCRRAGRQVQVH